MRDDTDIATALADTDEFISKMLFHYPPDAIAACMILKGLGVYKAMFSDEEYELICEKIYEDRYKVKPLEI